MGFLLQALLRLDGTFKITGTAPIQNGGGHIAFCVNFAEQWPESESGFGQMSKITSLVKVS